MPYTDEEINNLIRQTTLPLVAKIVNLQDSVAELAAQLDMIPKPAASVVFKYEFPDFDKVTQIKGQLFHNKPNRSGQHGGARLHEWVLKVGVWTCPPDEIRKYRDGTVKPYCFPLHTPSNLRPKQEGSTLSQLVDQGVRDDIELIGCREVKGPGTGVKGTEANENQIAAITSSRELRFAIPDWLTIEWTNRFVPKGEAVVEGWIWRRQ